MGTLVNPVGWRLNSNRYWKVNFFTADLTFSILNSNQRVYYKIIAGVLDRLNKIFYLHGRLRFIKHILFAHKGEFTLLVTVRFYTDQLLREKMARKYKYSRLDLRRFKKSKKSLISWIKRAIVDIKLSQRRIGVLKKEISFIEKNKSLIINKLEKIKLKKVLTKKIDLLAYLRYRVDRLRHRMLYRAYCYSKSQFYRRNLRLHAFLKEEKFRIYYDNIVKDWVARAATFNPIFRHKRNVRVRVKVPLRITSGYGFNRLKRWGRFLPSYRLRRYLHHRWSLRRRLRMRHTFIFSNSSHPRSPLSHVRRRKVVVRRRAATRRKRRARRSLINGRKFLFRPTFERRVFWKRWRRKKVRWIKMYNRLRKRLRWWQLPRKRGVSWRVLPYLKRKSFKKRWRPKLLFYFKLIPFMVFLKEYFRYLFVKDSNVFVKNIYFLNASKSTALNAATILYFVEKFLRRRRRVTKINKLFYKIMKILRFFKAKYKLRGFKFLLAGRFLRRDRATYIWRTRGAVPLATKLSKIDYAVRPMQMKYSRPIAKLWICKK